jgi:hypothetical protein
MKKLVAVGVINPNGSDKFKIDLINLKIKGGDKK